MGYHDAQDQCQIQGIILWIVFAHLVLELLTILHLFKKQGYLNFKFPSHVSFTSYVVTLLKSKFSLLSVSARENSENILVTV